MRDAVTLVTLRLRERKGHINQVTCVRQRQAQGLHREAGGSRCCALQLRRGVRMCSHN